MLSFRVPSARRALSDRVSGTDSELSCRPHGRRAMTSGIADYITRPCAHLRTAIPSNTLYMNVYICSVISSISFMDL